MLHASPKSLVFVCLIVLLGSQGIADALACPICFGFPKKTDADFLLDGCCVTLARPQELDPFQYAHHEILKGTNDGSKIDLLVDSATRRLFEVRPDRHVLLVQEVPKGPWQTLGPVSPEFEAVARRLITVGAGWRGSQAAQLRWEFFLQLFDHPDERIRQLAYLEMGRAPYSVVRQLERTVSRNDFAVYLDDRRYTEWQGLAILLLAQSNSAVDRQSLLDSFENAARFGIITNLSARAAAAIEIDPIGTIDRIEVEYFARADRTREELEAILCAVSMHGSQDNAELRNRIVASYERLLEHAPQFAPQVASDLLAWNRSELTARLSAILTRSNAFDFAATRAIRHYLQRSTVRNETGQVDD